eukprot:2911783-Rhodomonas_salina.2
MIKACNFATSRNSFCHSATPTTVTQATASYLPHWDENKDIFNLKVRASTATTSTTTAWHVVHLCAFACTRKSNSVTVSRKQFQLQHFTTHQHRARVASIAAVATMQLIL